jgi:hypothetical protein
MKQPQDMLRKSLAVATMAFALAGAGAGAAWASPPTPPTPPTSSTPPPPPPTHGTPANHPAPAPAPRPVPVADSGQVTAVNARTLSVRGSNGRTTVFQLTSRTVFLKNGRAVVVGQIASQDRVQVTGVRTGNALTANRVVDTGR